MREMWANGERRFSVEQGMELLLDVLSQKDVPPEEVVPLTMRWMRWTRVAVIKWCEWTELDARKMIATEERLYASLPLPGGEVVQITGQLDLLLADPPDGVIVIDYKTGFGKPPDVRAQTDEEVSRAKSDGKGLTELGWVQNLIYSYLIFENFPSIDRVTFKERHVMWKQERVAHTERWQMERLKDPLIAQVGQLHRAVLEGEASQIWTPSAGAHCSMCSRPRDCPIKDVEGIPASYEDAQRMAQEWIVAGETRKRRAELLKGWVDQHGPVEVPHASGRRVVGYELEKSRSLKLFEPPYVPDSPYDELLAEAAEKSGALVS